MITYSERVFNVSDADEIKRLREYIAALKAELRRVRALDPVEFWFDEMSRYQRAINILMDIAPNKRTQDQEDRLERYRAQFKVVTERYRLARAPKRNGYNATQPEAWEDITGDIIWSQTEFIQAARTGPGSFRITLKGDHPEFRAGEEIHVEVDDFRVFGGYVTSVERSFFFADAVSPKTVLYGTDYNILFDRLAPRNYASELAGHYDTRMMAGKYRSWEDFPQGTLDSDIFHKVFDEYLLPDLPLGFDYINGVESIATPAPVTKWTMPTAGSALRLTMQSVSQITTGVWSIDPYMVLQYHDRGEVTAPFPVTDGLGDISSRNLTVTTDISNMINDVLVWGTLARTVEGEIMVWHEEGDLGFWERRYLLAIAQNQKLINRLLALPKRTTAQNKAIATYRARIVTYKARLQDVRARAWDPLSGLPRPANAIVNSVATWGRWQMGEFREDIHHQEWLNIRGHSILTRYDEPIIRATATIYDPGYAAGQVTKVKSATHGLDTDLVIRQVRLSFAVGKEPFEGKFYALPQYDLEMGLEPEAPWNIYDYLPYPGEGTPGLGGDTTGG